MRGDIDRGTNAGGCTAYLACPKRTGEGRGQACLGSDNYKPLLVYCQDERPGVINEYDIARVEVARQVLYDFAT